MTFKTLYFFNYKHYIFLWQQQQQQQTLFKLQKTKS